MVRGSTKLGNVVRDTITGYTGVVTARTEYLNGCIRLQVQAQQLKETGEPVDLLHVDEEQVTVLGEVEADRFAGRMATGGERDATRLQSVTKA